MSQIREIGGGADSHLSGTGHATQKIEKNPSSCLHMVQQGLELIHCSATMGIE